MIRSAAVEKTVGVIGGMGPEATVLFFQELVALTPARCDQDHLRVLVYNDPKIPDRTLHLTGKGPSPLADLQHAARALESMGADLIAIPCNTAHAYFDELCAAVKIPILHIARETVNAVAGRLDSPASLAVLGTIATIRTRLYHAELERRGYRTTELPTDVQEWVTDCINFLKGHDHREEARDYLRRACDFLAGQGADGIILGCTELGLADPPEELPTFDSLKILAQSTLRAARGGGVMVERPETAKAAKSAGVRKKTP